MATKVYKVKIDTAEDDCLIDTFCEARNYDEVAHGTKDEFITAQLKMWVTVVVDRCRFDQAVEDIEIPTCAEAIE